MISADREAFRKRMQEYKSSGLKYWDWKANSYATGTDDVEPGEDGIWSTVKNAVGNAVDNVKAFGEKVYDTMTRTQPMLVPMSNGSGVGNPFAVNNGKPATLPSNPAKEIGYTTAAAAAPFTGAALANAGLLSPLAQSAFTADLLNRRVLKGEGTTYDGSQGVLNGYVNPFLQDVMDASIAASWMKPTADALKWGWNWADRNYIQPYKLYREIGKTSPAVEELVPTANHTYDYRKIISEPSTIDFNTARTEQEWLNNTLQDINKFDRNLLEQRELTNNYTLADFDNLPEAADATAYLNLRGAGFKPRLQNVIDSEYFLKKRTPQPKIPYDQIVTDYMPSGAKNMDPKDDLYYLLGNFMARDGEMHIPYEIDPALYEPYNWTKTAGRQAMYNSSKTHELVHATGSPTNEAFEELLKILDYSPKITKAEKEKYIQEYTKQFWQRALNAENTFNKSIGYPEYKDVESFLNNNNSLPVYDEATSSNIPLRDFLSNQLNSELAQITDELIAQENFYKTLSEKTDVPPYILKYLIGLGSEDANATEIDARLSQLLNYAGVDLTNINKITGNVLKDAALADPTFTNNSSEFIKLMDHIGWDKISDLVKSRKYGKAIIPATIATGYASQDQSKEYADGGIVGLDSFIPSYVVGTDSIGNDEEVNYDSQVIRLNSPDNSIMDTVAAKRRNTLSNFNRILGNGFFILKNARNKINSDKYVKFDNHGKPYYPISMDDIENDVNLTDMDKRFIRYKIQAAENLKRAEFQCLRSTLDFDVMKSYVAGYDSWRKKMDKLNIDQLINNMSNSKQEYTDRTPGKFAKANGWSSWYLRDMLKNKDFLDIEKLNSDPNYLNYPMGTLFTIGYAANKQYIPAKDKFDENGVERPSHTYSFVGFAADEDTNEIFPIVNDQGRIGTHKALYGNRHAAYAFKPKDRNNFTYKHIKDAYDEYRKPFKLNKTSAVDEYKDRVNEIINELDYDRFKQVSKTYDLPEEVANRIVERLMGLASKETKLDYTIDDPAFFDIKQQVKDRIRRTKSKFSQTTKANLKAIGAGFNKFLDLFKGVGPINDYDTMSGYQREMEVYDDLKASGQLNDLSVSQQRDKIREEYNRRAAEYDKNDIDYGKVKSSFDSKMNTRYNDSRGMWQLKYGEDFHQEDMYPEFFDKARINYYKLRLKAANTERDKLKYKNAVKSAERKYAENQKHRDDIERNKGGFNDVYEKFVKNYTYLRDKHPDLTYEQLLDLATVMWNSPKKANDSKFIDHYIKDRTLKDDYLEKVQNAEKQLYGNNYKGLIYSGTHGDIR